MGGAGWLIGWFWRNFCLKDVLWWKVKVVGSLQSCIVWQQKVVLIQFKNAKINVWQTKLLNMSSIQRIQACLGGGFKYIYFFHPYLGKIPNLTNIFQMGWNHQPVVYRVCRLFLVSSPPFFSKIPGRRPLRHLYWYSDLPVRLLWTSWICVIFGGTMGPITTKKCFL